jgi:hypothetical protein
MSKLFGNLAYISYIVILLYYLWLASYSQYINTSAEQNYNSAQDTVISYTHKK